MKINDGLILPFRFYDAQEKQMRYRGCGRFDQDDVMHNEYLICYGCRLLPFQIIRASDPSTTTNLSIVNINTGVETDLTSDIVAADWSIETIGEFDYITYFGNNDIDDGSCLIAECIYEAKFNDGNNTWWSELFQVVQSGFDYTDYRIWSNKAGGSDRFRIWDSDTDLRIVKDE